MDEVVESRTRVERSTEQWKALIAQFRSSGMSRAQFCKANEVAPSTFGKALRRHAKGSGTKTIGHTSAPSSTLASSFVPVSVPVSDELEWDVEVQLSAQVFVRVRSR